LSSAAEIMVFDENEVSNERPPENAVMFLLWLQRKLSDVHARYRNEVRIEIGRDLDCGAFIKLSYPRPAARLTKECRTDMPNSSGTAQL
jgi:hypothetical protein